MPDLGVLARTGHRIRRWNRHAQGAAARGPDRLRVILIFAVGENRVIGQERVPVTAVGSGNLDHVRPYQPDLATIRGKDEVAARAGPEEIGNLPAGHVYLPQVIAEQKTRSVQKRPGVEEQHVAARHPGHLVRAETHGLDGSAAFETVTGKGAVVGKGPFVVAVGAHHP